MMVDKLGAGVGMQLGPRERGAVPHGVQAIDGRFLSFVPLRPSEAPERRNISAICGEYIRSRSGIAAMRHGVDLRDANLRRIPAVHADGHHGDDGAFLCGAFAAEVAPRARESSDILLHAPHAHAAQFLRRLAMVRPALVAHRYINIFTDHGMQILSACLCADLPNLFQGRDAVRSVYDRPSALFRSAWIMQLSPPEALDCRLAGESGHLNHRIKDCTFALFVRRPVRILFLLKYSLFVRHIHMATWYPIYYLPERFRCCLLLSTTGGCNLSFHYAILKSARSALLGQYR